jgi:beta-lactamase regulating signal transducer with metallopeptidase domain
MIAAWMLYCSLCALGLAAAAALAERLLLAGRAPVRLVWVCAIALSLLVPPAVFRAASSSAPAAVVSAAPVVTVDEQSINTPPRQPASVTAAPPVVPAGIDWQAKLARLDTPLLVAWVALSLAVAISLGGGMIALAWMRRRWERREVLGTSVLVSKRTGPAIVGAMSPAIVVPEWALAMDPAKLALMLRHEQEHRRAGDSQLMTVARLALVAMPWNVALWWQVLRLRVAVEMDCDARVLRDADARSYGDLLLEVARPRHAFVGAMAFAERAMQLERRIRVMSRHRVRTSRVARVLAVALGLVAVSAAWVAPRPPVPDKPVTVKLPPVVVAPTPRLRPPAVAAQPITRRAATTQTTRIPGLVVASRNELEMLPIVAPAPVVVAPCGGSTVVNAAYDRLYDGITLSGEQQTKACQILARLESQQAIWTLRATAASLIERQRVQVQRDSALRALLTNDADRATFDARVATGGRGRGGGGGARGGRGVAALPDSQRPGGFARGQRYDSLLMLTQPPGGAARGGGRGGRGGGGGGVARGGGGGGRGADTAGFSRGYTIAFFDSTRQSTALSFVDATFKRLFDGITLTAEQEATARKIIADTQEQLMARPRVSPGLVVDPGTSVVSVRSPGDVELVDLLTREVDRATVRSRLTTLPQ